MCSISRPASAPGAHGAVSIRRFVNDEIAQLALRLDPDDGKQYEFMCECGELGCDLTAILTVAEYHTSPPGSVVCHSARAA